VAKGRTAEVGRKSNMDSSPNSEEMPWIAEVIRNGYREGSVQVHD